MYIVFHESSSPYLDPKRMLTGKTFSSNENVIAETEVYFEAMKKLYYTNGIEKLVGRYTIFPKIIIFTMVDRGLFN